MSVLYEGLNGVKRWAYNGPKFRVKIVNRKNILLLRFDNFEERAKLTLISPAKVFLTVTFSILYILTVHDLFGSDVEQDCSYTVFAVFFLP